MGIKFACHECGKPLNIKTQLAGKRGKCPVCGLRFRIPHSDQPFSIPLDEQESHAGVVPQADNQEEESSDGEIKISDKQAEQKTDLSSGAAKPSEPEEDFDPLADPDAQWYVRPPNGGRYGPASGETVRQWIREGRVTLNTLIWRDGWAQWRDCSEIIPEAFASAPAPQTSKLPPQIAPEITSPVFNLENTHKAMAGTPATLGTEPVKSDVYLGAKKRRRSRQRVTLISILAGIAVILVIALVVALAWSR